MRGCPFGIAFVWILRYKNKNKNNLINYFFIFEKAFIQTIDRF